MNAGIQENQAWILAEARLGSGIPTITRRLTVGGHDLYAKFGFDAGRPVFVDVTLGRSATDAARHDNCGVECGHRGCMANELATRVVDGVRAQLEVICRQASALLQANVWTLDDLVDAWIGTQFEPSGVCPEAETIAHSPLDAIAKIARRDGARWQQEMGGAV